MGRKERRQASKLAKQKKPEKGQRAVSDSAALFQSAVADFQAGRLKAAEDALDCITRDHSGIPDVFQLRGMIALQSGRKEEAVKFLREGVSADPQSPGLADLLGTALAESGQFEEAETAYRRALNRSPNDAGVLNNLGNVLKKLGRLEDSRDAYRESLKLRSGHANTEVNFGNVLESLEDFEGAEAAYRRAIDAGADDSDAHCGLGRMMLALGKLDELEAPLARALELNPDHAGAHEVLCIKHFLKGRFSDAWEAYGWRWWKDTDRRQDFTQQVWSGEPVDGKTVLVWGEQGVGDEILFAGMVPDLLEAGATVIMECDKRLIPLFGRSFAGVEYLIRDNATPATAPKDIDFQTPSGSLGRWLRPDLDSFPGRESYLVADAERRDAFRSRYLKGGDDRLVGIAWTSINPRIGRGKSMPLLALAPLTDIPGIRFVDLQYGDTAEERARFGRQTGTPIIHDDGIDQMNDLDSFAAQVAAMDLVISVSNTTVHLSGALGVPTWVMLPTMPMWRWMAEGEDSPWYPSLRLFRQTEAGEWADVIGRVAAALADFT
ncbi:MAG: tetratricopeptide repeat protein [Proteobacteria bacterium]|nr:tetratricopeptide repeat protein [Pseudomonadota bacterium]